jgi:hypothetical protein
VHDINLKKWAIQKSRELNINFKASNSWINRFKNKYRIRSRKITKFINITPAMDKQKTENAIQFVNNSKLLFQNFDHDHILNTDQSGFNYEMYSQRTLSDVGESKTEVSATSLNALTHSYTIQPVISFEGKLVGKLLLCLQETNGKFGPIVEQGLFQPNNIEIVCSSSGKMNKSLIKKFAAEIIKPIINKDFVLMLDSWSGHNKSDIYDDIFQDFKCNLRVIPPGTTYFLQPLDKLVFRQWKYFVKTMYNYVAIEGLNIELRLRNNIIKMHSLIYNQLQSPLFYRMFKNSWQKCGYYEETVETYDSVKNICFNFNIYNCNEINCKEMSFICCSHCRNFLCFHHFFNDYHIHELN